MQRGFDGGFMARGILLFTCAALAAGVAAMGASRADDEKPYKVENGHVDQATYNGYRRYGESCLRCHGPDGAGSSYAPSLVDSLKQMDHDAFAEVVVNGRQDVNTARQNVMPAFGTVEDVMDYLDDIYAYLKARSDGVLGRGRPKRIGDEY
jgi:methanol metabolism-related c-type cytochrome